MSLMKRSIGFFKKIIQEVIYRLHGAKSSEVLSGPENAFLKENFTKWKNSKPARSKGYVLVEGILADYGPNYLYRTGLICQAIKSKHPDLIPVVLYDEMLHTHKKSIALYESFGITNHYSLAGNLINQLYRLYVAIISKQILDNCRTGEDLLKLKFAGIHIGDLVYDSITSSLKKDKTIDLIQEDMKSFIKRAIYDVLVYKRLLKRLRPEFLISTHPCYVIYGTLCRVALENNTRVILTTDIEVVELKKNSNPEVCFTPVYHEFVGNFVKNKVSTLKEKEKTISESKKYLETRLMGNIDQVDVQLAYASKEHYSEQILRQTLNLTENKPIVFIFAHIIADAPHCSHFLLFQDYYVWIKQTIEICKSIPDVYWLVKPHPAAKAYLEEGIVESLVEKAQCEHIKIVPSDYNTNSAFKYAHSLITINGTAGLEFSCFGVPVVLAGRPFYSDLGFTIQPENLEEYKSVLCNIKNLKKLDLYQIEKALLTLEAFRSYSITDNVVLTSDLLMKIWGYKERDIEFVFREMTSNLKNIDPKTEPQYLRALQII
ncbi:MAG: hypothetical protein K2P81_16340 [Bacteriovoracaceae bacterium]|nr:hypothetical protein [Bacteriovoracaceae bacterium]